MPRENSQPVALCDTSNMTNEQWLLMRTGKLHNIPCTIGGSEVAASKDESPWVCSKELADRKRGIKPIIQKEFNEENKLMGHIFEPYVQEMFILWFKKNYGIELAVCKTIAEFNACQNGIYNDRRWYQCGIKNEDGTLKYPQAVADVDGLVKVNGRIGILEYKTTNPDGETGRKTVAKWLNGIIPEYYFYQPNHYMAVLNLDYAFICCAWGFGLQKFACIPLERNLEFEDKMLEAEKKFAKDVVDGKEWDTSNCDPALLANYYTRLYGTSANGNKDAILPSAYFSLLKGLYDRKERRAQLQKQIEEMDEKDEELISILSPVVGDADYIVCRRDKETIKIKVKTPREKVECINIASLVEKAHIDLNLLEKDYPSLKDKYMAKVFDVRQFKIENPTVYARVRTEAKPTGNTKTYEATYRNLNE